MCDSWSVSQKKIELPIKNRKIFAYLCINLNDWGMSDIIIGRKAEQEILRQRIESKPPELTAFYGRRRIGKTYLVRQYFKDTFNYQAV
ncbi:MAG: hypothetical protein UHS50_01475 [Bacteroidaceae bacterium]|nr:hypothetical protein [Bacteroidaceae bacterium]